MTTHWRQPFRTLLTGCCVVCAAVGCGTTRDKLATEQMLLSDAVDRAVARIDFSPLSREKVFLDTTYLNGIKGTAFVNADYIISSLRQQMASAGCLLQEKREDATYVAEARVGALGSDAYDVNYGVPGSNGLTAAASLVAGSAPLPSLPEISFARKTDDTAATKVAVFAYDRISREPVWQSGLSVARSRAQARWLLGAGPFHSGTIYEGTQFPGRLGTGILQVAPKEPPSADVQQYRNFAVYSNQLRGKLEPRAPDAELLATRQADERHDPGSSGRQTETDSEPPPETRSEIGEPAAAVQRAEHLEETIEPAGSTPESGTMSP